MTFFKKLKSLFNDDDNGMGILYQSKGLKSTGETYGKTHFLNAYKASLYVNKAIEKRATKVGEIEFELKRGDKDVEDDKNGIIKLLSKPNAIQSGKQFFALWQKYKDIFGEVFVLMVSNTQFLERRGVSELHLLNPRYVTKHYLSTGEIEKIDYQPNGGAESKTYSGEEIIYDSNPDPDNPLNGMSLLQAGMKSITTGTQLDEYQSTILRNGGKIEGVFNFKTTGNLSKIQREELKKDYKDMYAESSKSGVPLFLGGDADYKRLGVSPEELSYIESKKMTLNDICILTEVPKMLLSSSEDIQYNNAETSLRIFLREVVKPLQEQIAEVLNECRALVPEELELEIEDPTPEDVELKTKVISNGMTNYYMTINEAREMMDMESVDGGDEILTPFSVSPLSQTVAEPEPMPEPLQPTEELKPEPVEEPPMNDEPEEKSKKKSINHPLKSYDFRREYWKQGIKKDALYEKKFKALLNRYFKEQKQRMLDNIEQGRITSFKKKSLIDEIFNLRQEIGIGVSLMMPLMKEVARRSGEDAMKLLGTGGFKMNPNIESWLDLKANVFLKQINETTFTKLKSEFADSFANNEGRPELINRLKETYGNISKGRASMIARTETHGITQEATLQGYKQADMPIKIWVAVMDDKTRDSHAEIDGEEVPINYPFSNGLQMPGDPSGPPEEVINCRCRI